MLKQNCRKVCYTNYAATSRKEVRCILDTLIMLAVSVLTNIIADRICKYPDKR